jgi:hypothetical protein
MSGAWAYVPEFRHAQPVTDKGQSRLTFLAPFTCSTPIAETGLRGLYRDGTEQRMAGGVI